jgi:hypothetical protein
VREVFEEMKPAGLPLFFLLLLSLSVFGQMQILNRSFEQAAPIDPGDPPYYFTPPLYWSYENYAALHSGPFDPNNENVQWVIPGPYEGNYFLLLSTDGFGPYQDRDISLAFVRQRLYLPAKTLIQGAYFFGTCDWPPYCDVGTIELKPYNDPNHPDAPFLWHSILLAQCSVDDVGRYGSTEQWLTFSRIISPEEEGYYDLTLSVEDGLDKIVESYFAVDDLRICGPGVLLGDLCQDCIVDLQDLSLFSKEWLEICPIDPNDPNEPIDPNAIDPNCLCIYADFSKDNTVDVNDLDLFKDDWLQNNL